MIKNKTFRSQSSVTKDEWEKRINETFSVLKTYMLMFGQVQSRLAGIEERYKEVAELTRLRKQALQDALALYKMRSEANACEVWIDEKEQWLNSMDIPEKLEDLEVVQHRSVSHSGCSLLVISTVQGAVHVVLYSVHPVACLCSVDDT